MSKRLKIASILVLPCLLVLGMTGCLEETVIEIVLMHEATADFSQDSASEVFEDTAVVDFGTEMDDALAAADFERSDISDAFMVSVDYGVTAFQHSHDWVISGAITVQRKDIAGDAVTILNYTSQSVADALGERISAVLTSAGVDEIDKALADYLNGGHPTLEFVMLNGGVEPGPNEGDRIVFDWRAWLVMHIVYTQTVERPDPF